MRKHLTSRATATMNAKSVAGGIFLIAVAGFGLFFNRGYDLGSAANMGPGYMPMLVLGLLALLGVAILVSGLTSGHEPLERWAWRELALIIGAMTAFGVLLDKLGLGLAVATAVVISCMADRSQTVLGTAVLTVVLVFLTWLIFIFALGINLPLLPPALS